MTHPEAFNPSRKHQKQEMKEMRRIAAVLDDFVVKFDFRGLKVERVGGSIRVRSKDGNVLGGSMLIESASVLDIFDWLENKAEYYGDNQ